MNNLYKIIGELYVPYSSPIPKIFLVQDFVPHLGSHLFGLLRNTIATNNPILEGDLQVWYPITSTLRQENLNNAVKVLPGHHFAWLARALSPELSAPEGATRRALAAPRFTEP